MNFLLTAAQVGVVILSTAFVALVGLVLVCAYVASGEVEGN